MEGGGGTRGGGGRGSGTVNGQCGEREAGACSAPGPEVRGMKRKPDPTRSEVGCIGYTRRAAQLEPHRRTPAS